MPDDSSPPAEDAYAQIAPWYDREHDAFDDDIQFYRDLVGSGGLSILEIGCGSGRVTVPLARMGSTLTGVDASAAMLALCRTRLAAEPASVRQRVTLVRADARALGGAVPHAHALALMPLNTFAHFSTPGDRVKVLDQVRAHVVPGGRLVVDVDLAGPRRLLANPGLLWLMGVWDLNEARDVTSDQPIRVTHFVTAVPDTEPDTALVTHLYDAQGADGVVHRAISHMSIGILTRHEVELTIERAGFTIEAVYGSYELDPYRVGAERAIFVAHT
jgi:SAM-dependent methyltransferase